MMFLFAFELMSSELYYFVLTMYGLFVVLIFGSFGNFVLLSSNNIFPIGAPAIIGYGPVMSFAILLYIRTKLLAIHITLREAVERMVVSSASLVWLVMRSLELIL